MTAARILLLGTILLSTTLVSEVVADGNTNQKLATRPSAYDRFRPGSLHSASGMSSSRAMGPNSSYNNRNSAGPSGLPQQTFATVQHDLKPALTNELRLATTSIKKVKATESSVPDFEPTGQEAISDELVAAKTTKLKAKPPADPLIEKIGSVLAAEPVKELKNTTKPTESAREATSEATSEVSEETSDTRKLGFSAAVVSEGAERVNSPFNELLTWRPSTNSMVTMGSGLAVVLGLVMVAGWVARKSMPRSARVLPNEVAEVLGRVVLSSRQTAQLLKLGNKLLLVSVTADGAETLTEIEDPEEVQRLLQLSEEALGRGSNAEFERVFQQLANGPAVEGFLGEEAPAYDDPRFQDARYQDRDNVHYDAQRLAAAYANTPGGRSHAA